MILVSYSGLYANPTLASLESTQEPAFESAPAPSQEQAPEFMPQPTPYTRPNPASKPNAGPTPNTPPKPSTSQGPATESTSYIAPKLTPNPSPESLSEPTPPNPTEVATEAITKVITIPLTDPGKLQLVSDQNGNPESASDCLLLCSLKPLTYIPGNMQHGFIIQICLWCFSGLYETTPNANALNDIAGETADEVQAEKSIYASGMKQTVEENQITVPHSTIEETDANFFDVDKLESYFEKNDVVTFEMSSTKKSIPEQLTKRAFLFSTNARILDFRSNKKERSQKQRKKIKFEIEKNKVSTSERSLTKTYEVKEKLNPEQTSRREFLFSTYARKITENLDNHILVESNEYFSYESFED